MPVAAARAARTPERIGRLFERLESDKADVKYGAAKALRQISEERPEDLYPHFDDLLRLFEGENTILRWGATRILGNLAVADVEGRMEKVFDRYFAPISGHEMIGAANVIVAAAQIAVAKPNLAGRIAREILKVEQAAYHTPECRNVAIGHAIKSFDRIFRLIEDGKPVLEFVARQLDNPRQATRRKAERFVKRWGSQSQARPGNPL